jgi:hypothetical protein
MFFSTIDADDNALRAKSSCKLGNKRRVGQSRGVNRNFVRAFVEYILSVGD